MKKLIVPIITACLLMPTKASAADSLATSITYDLTTEAAVGTGRHTAYQLVTNRHHILATRPNTAYARAAIKLQQPITTDFAFSAMADGVASVHADHKAYLQQCFARLDFKEFFAEVGASEPHPAVRNEVLSAGLFANGTNAKPVPQVHVGTREFWNVPLTAKWVQIHFDFGYGKFLDNAYREAPAHRGGDASRAYATGAFYHQKHLYIRTNPTKPFFFTAGIEHAVQFGGTSHAMVGGEMQSKEKKANLKAFWNVILPLGDAHYFENEALEDWVYGNHVGMMTCQFGFNIDRHHQLNAYLDNPFEDGSGIRKSNGSDGLWGIEYANSAPGRQLVRGAVVEYFQSTNQCGPLHWDSGDYPEPARSEITDKVTGNDNYYNHMFYVSYSHYGMTPGIALITSPIYNTDADNTFHDNRVKAWHLGINGELTTHLSYIIKGSYREGWGTYSQPLTTKNHSFDAMLQALYRKGPWQLSAAYAFDRGNIYGNCSTFNFKISFHGKIL